jgi:hypothetical protein
MSHPLYQLGSESFPLRDNPAGTQRSSLCRQIMGGRDLSGTFKTSRMDEAVQHVTGGLLSIGGVFSRSYNIQPPRFGMTEGEFKDLLNVADYSKAKGFKAEDIKKHGVFDQSGIGKYLVKVGPGYVQSESGPFVLDLGAIVKRAVTGANT